MESTELATCYVKHGLTGPHQTFSYGNGGHSTLLVSSNSLHYDRIDTVTIRIGTAKGLRNTLAYIMTMRTAPMKRGSALDDQVCCRDASVYHTHILKHLAASRAVQRN